MDLLDYKNLAKKIKISLLKITQQQFFLHKKLQYKKIYSEKSIKTVFNN